MSEVPSHGRKSLFTAIWMGRYWQQDQFRSSFAPPNGREISFGAVRLVDLRLNALYLVRKPTLKEKAPLDWGFRGQFSRFYYSETRLVANASEKTTPKLVWLPTGLSRLLRNSFRCQWGRLQVLRTRFVARLLASRLPEPSDVCFAGL